MQEKKPLVQEINIFIDFQIIKDSHPVSLSKELDVLIASGRKIHVWSKTISRDEMKKYCSTVIISTSKEEQKLHNEIYLLRHKDRLTFNQISKKTDIPIEKISYYSKANPLRQWVLDDWITSYEVKDPSFYSKVDILIDPDEKLVQRFKRAGRTANLITKV